MNRVSYVFATLFLLHFVSYVRADTMSNVSFTLTNGTLLSAGGTGSSGSASANFVLKAYTMGEPASESMSNDRFTLKGGLLAAQSSEAREKRMRINVRGIVDDPDATLYVNEICAVNQGGTWMAPFVSVSEGPNELHVHASDAQGNERETMITVIVDTRPPAMPTASYETPTANLNPTITGVKEKGNELYVRLGQDEVLIPGFFDATAWTYQATLREGENRLEFFVTDPAGNKSAAYPVDIVLDTDTTMFTVLSPRDGSLTQASAVELVGRIWDGTADITVEGAPVALYANGNFFKKSNVLLPLIGSNTISVHAHSITGFSQDASISVIRNSAADFPPTLEPLSAYLGVLDAELKGDCDVDASVVVLLNGSPRAGVPCSAGRWNYSAILGIGENLISVEALDASQQSIAGPAASVFVDITAPTTPVVSDGGSTQSSVTQIAVSWFSYDFETAVVDFEYAVGTTQTPPSGVIFQSAGAAGTFAINGDFVLGQTYFIYVRAKNAAGLASGTGVSDGILISDNQIPTILTLLPETGEFRYPGETINWRLVVQDPDEDVLQFSYALNGQTKFAFSEQAERNYMVPTNMFGRQRVQGLVRDDPGSTFQEWPSAETSFYVARRPVEP